MRESSHQAKRNHAAEYRDKGIRAYVMASRSRSRSSSSTGTRHRFCRSPMSSSAALKRRSLALAPIGRPDGSHEAILWITRALHSGSHARCGWSVRSVRGPRTPRQWKRQRSHFSAATSPLCHWRAWFTSGTLSRRRWLSRHGAVFLSCPATSISTLRRVRRRATRLLVDVRCRVVIKLPQDKAMDSPQPSALSPQPSALLSIHPRNS